MSILLLFIVGISIDFVVALMSGTVLYLLWDWLINPTFEIIALSWTAAVAVAFVIRFLTGTTGDVFNTDPNDFWPYMGRVLGNNTARCISYLFLGACLLFVV